MLASQRGGAEQIAASVTSMLKAYQTVRASTEALAAPLSPEDQVPQSMELCSPVKWHRAHTTWFFETFLLRERMEGYVPDADYRVLFNSYYNGIGEQYHRPHRGLITRPGVAEVSAYRRRVDEAVLAHLNRDPTEGDLQLIQLGLHHEQQHQELLLTDLKHLFGHNPTHPIYAPRPPDPAQQNRTAHAFHEHSGGIVEVGHGGVGFAYDNESPRHQALLQPFALGTRLITEGEYLAFLEDGGYRRPELWLSAGWDAVRALGWQAPLYWQKQPEGWSSYTLHGLQPLQPDSPLSHVSYYEADAYARWAGARLPTEFEWEAVCADHSADPALGGPTGLHPRADDNDQPVSELFGICWQWTRSDYAPYPGYQPPAGAVGEYNGKFMSGQYVLRGSSCATPGGHARPSYRNFFPADARFQFSGIRLAKDLTS